MRNLLLVLPLIVSVSCAQVPGLFPVSSGRGVRAGTGGTSTLIAGVTPSTLYAGYWEPPEPITHYENDKTTAMDPIAQYDPQQSTYTWIIDTVAERANMLSLLENLRAEWDTASYKLPAGGTFDYTYYVDWATGSDSNDGSTGSPWKNIQKGVDYVVANHLDGGGVMTASVKIVLKAGVQYIAANYDGPVVKPLARVFMNNLIGTASNPLVFAGETGDMEDVIVRVDPALLETNWSEYQAMTMSTEAGFHIRNACAYIQFWDMTLIGTLYEARYYEGSDVPGGAIHTYNFSGSNISVINCEIAQWCHAGLKGHDLNSYGNYIHDNAVTGHDHNFYMANQQNQTVMGNLFVNAYQGLHIVAREPDPNSVDIVGNVLIGTAGRAMHIGGEDVLVAHNFTMLSDDYGLQMQGMTRIPRFYNNVLYEGTPALVGASGSYKKVIGYTFATNAKPTASSAPTNITLSPHPGAGVAMDENSNIKEGGNNYACYDNTPGLITGATAPTHTSGTVSDGGVPWTYLGTQTETVGTWVDVDTSDFEDFSSYDVRPATGSDLLGNGTDIGYGTTIGPFNAAP